MDAVTNFLVIFFRIVGMTIAFLSWLTVGLVIWLFLMVRHFFVLTGLSVMAAFGDVDMSVAIENMQTAVSFYPDGFQRIYRSFISANATPGGGSLWPTLWRFVLECYASAIFFWYPVSKILNNTLLDKYVGGLLWPFAIVWSTASSIFISIFNFISHYLPHH